MIDITEIIEKRKYFFSLKPSELYHHFLMQNVPEMPGFISSHRDHVNRLYAKLREANQLDYDFRYTEHLTRMYLARIKEAVQIFSTQNEVLPVAMTFRMLPRYKVYLYENTSEILVRKHERLNFGEHHINFQFHIYENMFEFLKHEFEQNTNFKKYQLLRDLSDTISFDCLIMCSYLNQSEH